MAERFERYREEVVRRFYEEHFSRFDRQIVLVDLIAALNAGPLHFADTQKALEVIMTSFRYGSSGLLGRLFAPKIDKAPVRRQQGRPRGAEPLDTEIAPGVRARFDRWYSGRGIAALQPSNHRVRVSFVDLDGGAPSTPRRRELR